MIEDTLERIESLAEGLVGVDARKKAELLRLLGALRAEIKGNRPSRPLRQALDALSAAAKDFEASHPKLVEAIDAVCRECSSLGI